MGGEAVYRHYDQQELDRQYAPAQTVADLGAEIRRYAAGSAEARRSLDCVCDLEYGPSADERLDLFPPRATQAPVHVFLHGGRWQLLNKEESAFMAPALVGAGALFVALGFGRAPQTPIDGMVAQIRGALGWLYHNVARYGGDPRRLHVSGHSSGAHLAAMLLAPGWAEAAGLPADALRSVLLISGIYDLTPVRLTYRNRYLGLDDEVVRRMSPIRNVEGPVIPATVAVAQGDTCEFHRQAAEFYAALKEHGSPGEFFSLPGRHHFNVLDSLADPACVLARTACRQMGLSAESARP